MKIAMVCNPHVSVPPKRYGGIEQIVHVLCEGLTDKGHEVHLYATGDSKTSGFCDIFIKRAPGLRMSTGKLTTTATRSRIL